MGHYFGDCELFLLNFKNFPKNLYEKIFPKLIFRFLSITRANGCVCGTTSNFANMTTSWRSECTGQATESSDVLGVLPNIIAYVIGITAVLAIIAATWAGIQMFLSVGNEQKFDEARNILIYALVGVGLAGGAFLIVQIVSNLSFK